MVKTNKLINFIKVITFYVGVDVLGFPLTHDHVLKYWSPNKSSSKFLGQDEVGTGNNKFLPKTVHTNKNQIKYNKNERD